MRQVRKQKQSLFRSYRVTIALAVANIAVIALLLSFMTHTDNQANSIASYTQQLSRLNIQNQVLQDKIASAQNVGQITQKAQELGMVQPTSVVYLSTTNGYAENLQQLGQ